MKRVLNQTFFCHITWLALMSKWTQEYENELLRKTARGDRRAFSEVYDRYAPPLFSLAIRILDSRSDAEEVVQDVFHSIWKQAETFDASRARPFTWMTAMTRNRCIDRLRARSSRIATSEIRPGAEEAYQLENIVSEDQINAADSLMQKEDFQSLKHALSDLPIEQKNAIELAFLSGMSHSEIADREMLSLGTVKARIRYGLEKLRNRYTKR